MSVIEIVLSLRYQLHMYMYVCQCVNFCVKPMVIPPPNLVVSLYLLTLMQTIVRVHVHVDLKFAKAEDLYKLRHIKLKFYGNMFCLLDSQHPVVKCNTQFLI